MKNILVAVDFTRLTDLLLEKAADLAGKYGAKLWLVHVAAPEPDFVGYDVGPQHIRDFRAQTLREEHRKLQAFAHELETLGIKSEALLIQGSTTGSLVEKAGEIKADLIIMGAHIHGNLFEKLIGSTWKDLIRSSRIPLLVIPEGVAEGS